MQRPTKKIKRKRGDSPSWFSSQGAGVIYCDFKQVGANEKTNSFVCRRCSRLVSAKKSFLPEKIRLACLNPPLVALGEVLAWIIHKITFGLVEPCPSCDRRRRWLNRWFYVPRLWGKPKLPLASFKTLPPSNVPKV
jgi:hypothetical protein